MAWRSTGATNEELADNLKRFGVIRSQAVEDGFRATDRMFFVPPSKKEQAYADQPLRDGKLHISAPHIYGTVCEALDLQAGSSSSFLNIGAGSGYLSCIVAHILGPTSTSFAIELHDECVNHFRHATSAWRASLNLQEGYRMEIIQGDGLCIDTTSGEAAIGFDRIYIGAAIERSDLPQIANMLRPGGVLVGPVDEELIKVFRLAQTPNRSQAAAVPRSHRGRPPLLATDFETKVLSPVLFTPLVQNLNSPRLRIAPYVWQPSLHRYYPRSFHDSCKAILLCCSASKTQRRGRFSPQKVNLASMLPKALWIEILSYTHRHWFDKPQSEENVLRHRVQMLESSVEHAHETKRRLEKRLGIVQGERDLYRHMAQSLQARLRRILGENGLAEVLNAEEGVFIMGDERSAGGDEDTSVTSGSEDGDESLEGDDDMDEDSVTEMSDEDIENAEVVVVASTIANTGVTGRQARAVSVTSEAV